MSTLQASGRESARRLRKTDDTRFTWKVFLFGAVVVTAASFSTLNRSEQRPWFIDSREVWHRLLQTRIRSILLAASYLSASYFAQLSTVDAYLEKQIPLSKARLFANIGPDGINSSGAKAGVVIASPSTHNPDYLYTWTRDAALVLKTILQQYRYTRGEDVSLRITIDNYVGAQTIVQRVSNPSGTITTGGLGEPKFHINLTAFTDSWGRPQHDGPALRATTLIQYANWLIANGNASHVIDKIWPVIKLDLDYTASNWNKTGFDLWEEVSSSSFFTTAVQLRALREGVALATKLNQSASEIKYSKQVPEVYCFLQSYWNPTGNYMTSNMGGVRSGMDANSILASIHNFDPAAGCDSTTFQPCSDKALTNHKAYVDSFRSIYAVNREIDSSAAVATGRYSEDIYYNGNPWYLTTLAAAEQLYDALNVWNRTGNVNVTSISLPFFRQFSSSVTPGCYHSSSPVYTTLTSAIHSFADGFVAIAAKYTPPDGALAEQYDRNTGVPLSAKDLTWSYAALLSMSAARSGVVPDSWGATTLSLPKTCRNAEVIVSTTFNVDAPTVWGENIYIVGSIDALAHWSPDKALLLSSKDYPIWSLTVNLPANARFEYKYIRKGKGSVVWESDPDRSSTIPVSESYIINDIWR